VNKNLVYNYLVLYYIYLTNDIFIPININSKTIPFKFKISTYDFNMREIPAENKLVIFLELTSLIIKININCFLKLLWLKIKENI
jgi:hypothetical protein